MDVLNRERVDNASSPPGSPQPDAGPRFGSETDPLARPSTRRMESSGVTAEFHVTRDSAERLYFEGFVGAGDGARTRDVQLGKLALVAGCSTPALRSQVVFS